MIDFDQPVTSVGLKLLVPITSLMPRSPLYNPARYTRLKEKQVCANGHPWIPANLYSHSHNGKANVQCKICVKARSKARKAMLRSAHGHSAKTVQSQEGRYASRSRLKTGREDHTGRYPERSQEGPGWRQTRELRPDGQATLEAAGR